MGRNRTFSLELLCAPAAPQTRYDDASVIETNTCDYRMQLKSIAGCPLECVTGGSICSNNGVCGYDTDAGKSRCFCYNGFEGGNCGSAAPDQSGMSTEGIILIIVCCVLAGVIGLVAFMFIKLRKLQVDPAAYNELQGRCEQQWMLAWRMTMGRSSEPHVQRASPAVTLRLEPFSTPLCPPVSSFHLQSTSWVCWHKQVLIERRLLEVGVLHPQLLAGAHTSRRTAPACKLQPEKLRSRTHA